MPLSGHHTGGSFSRQRLQRQQRKDEENERHERQQQQQQQQCRREINRPLDETPATQALRTSETSESRHLLAASGRLAQSCKPIDSPRWLGWPPGPPLGHPQAPPYSMAASNLVKTKKACRYNYCPAYDKSQRPRTVSRPLSHLLPCLALALLLALAALTPLESLAGPAPSGFFMSGNPVPCTLGQPVDIFEYIPFADASIPKCFRCVCKPGETGAGEVNCQPWPDPVRAECDLQRPAAKTGPAKGGVRQHGGGGGGLTLGSNKANRLSPIAAALPHHSHHSHHSLHPHHPHHPHHPGKPHNIGPPRRVASSEGQGQLPSSAPWFPKPASKGNGSGPMKAQQQQRKQRPAPVPQMPRRPRPLVDTSKTDLAAQVNQAPSRSLFGANRRQPSPEESSPTVSGEEEEEGQRDKARPAGAYPYVHEILEAPSLPFGDPRHLERAAEALQMSVPELHRIRNKHTRVEPTTTTRAPEITTSSTTTPAPSTNPGLETEGPVEQTDESPARPEELDPDSDTTATDSPTTTTSLPDEATATTGATLTATATTTMPPETTWPTEELSTVVPPREPDQNLDPLGRPPVYSWPQAPAESGERPPEIFNDLIERDPAIVAYGNTQVRKPGLEAGHSSTATDLRGNHLSRLDQGQANEIMEQVSHDGMLYLAIGIEAFILLSILVMMLVFYLFSEKTPDDGFREHHQALRLPQRSPSLEKA